MWASVEEHDAENRARFPLATIGSRVSIGDGVIIGAGAIIEDRVTLVDYCKVGEGARVGRRAYVGYQATVERGAVIKPRATVWFRVSVDEGGDPWRPGNNAFAGKTLRAFRRDGRERHAHLRRPGDG